MIRWVVAATFALALHAGIAAYLLSPPRQAEGIPDGAMDVELMPAVSDPSDKPDDVAGPKPAEAAASTSETAQAEDPDPPAPDSAAPTEPDRKPEALPEPIAPPAPAIAQATLPLEPKPVDRPADPKLPDEKVPDSKKDKVERQTAPSRASSGSTAQLEGGRRPSAAAKATWAGAIGTHLAHLRRYPAAARAEGWQGLARVRVTIDENGHVKGRELVKSSGRSILDDEALALMQRSDPFPKPPTGMPTPVALTVPVNFAIH